MPAAPILDVEAMLLPVPGDDPAGRPLGLRDRNLLKEYREEHDPAKLSAEDLKDYALANKPRKMAEWNKLFEFGSDYLVKHGKDLRLVMLMTEAATHSYGFRGLRDSLKLTRRLCEECWGAMLPAIDDPTSPDDVEGRVTLFGYIDEELKTPFFPNVMRDVPLLTAGDVKFGFRNARAATTDEPGSGKENFDAALAKARPEQLKAVAEADECLAEAMTEVALLGAVLDAKAPGMSPGLTGLKKAMIDCRNMTQEMLRVRGDGTAGAAPGAAGDASDSAAGGPEGSGGSAGGGRSREGIYAQLLQLVVALEVVEPHSPVPFLVRRAIELRDAKFPELVDQLTSGKNVLDFLRQPIELDKPAEG
jgi:type VI secretion system protein ImpA